VTQTVVRQSLAANDASKGLPAYDMTSAFIVGMD
jgi:hypothetical protein